MWFINGTRAEDLAGTGLVTKQRLILPIWLSVLWLALVGLVKLIARLVAVGFRHPIVAASTGLLAVASVEYGKRGALGVFALIALALVGWLWRSPSTFAAKVVEPARGLWRWATFYGWVWKSAMHGNKLARTMPGRKIYVPTITRITSTGVVDTLHLRLMRGHTPEQLFEQAEGLRHSFKAHRLSVIEDGPGRVRLRVYSRDPLANTIPAMAVDRLPAVPDLLHLLVGISEAGEHYRLRLHGNHVLVAGATGAGKGSVLWSIVRSLGTGISSGLVRVTGLDPKGGMELHPGRSLFAHYADADGEEMAGVLEAAVIRMANRRTRMRDAGLRSFTPSLAEPFEVVVIDELAWLTAYHPDKRIRDRVKAALSLLLSQGRAVGFCLVACLQDPRKEVLSFRDLFPTRIALRLTEDSHVDMVLGDGALKRGAACHRIPDTLPGIGFVHVEGANEPVRVRFTWITDDQITDMADRWPAPGSQAQVINLTTRDRATAPDYPAGWSASGIESEPPGA